MFILNTLSLEPAISLYNSLYLENMVWVLRGPAQLLGWCFHTISAGLPASLPVTSVHPPTLLSSLQFILDMYVSLNECMPWKSELPVAGVVGGR